MAAPTIVISEEESYRLEQAYMPDGDTVELKVPKLSAPSVELSECGLKEYGFEQALHVSMITPMAGANTRQVYSLPEVEGFLKGAESSDSMNAQQDSIGYVDLGLLARWIEEVTGDTVLAEGVREVLAQEETFGRVMPFVKGLLQVRIAAYRQVLADAAAEAEAQANAEAGVDAEATEATVSVEADPGSGDAPDDPTPPADMVGKEE